MSTIEAKITFHFPPGEAPFAVISTDRTLTERDAERIKNAWRSLVSPTVKVEPSK